MWIERNSTSICVPDLGRPMAMNVLEKRLFLNRRLSDFQQPRAKLSAGISLRWSAGDRDLFSLSFVCGGRFHNNSSKRPPHYERNYQRIKFPPSFQRKKLPFGLFKNTFIVVLAIIIHVKRSSVFFFFFILSKTLWNCFW